jgi:hypothetical protein
MIDTTPGIINRSPRGISHPVLIPIPAVVSIKRKLNFMTLTKIPSFSGVGYSSSIL